MEVTFWPSNGPFSGFITIGLWTNVPCGRDEPGNPIFILPGGANHPVQDPFWGTNPILGWRDGLLAVLSKVQELLMWNYFPLTRLFEALYGTHTCRDSETPQRPHRSCKKTSKPARATCLRRAFMLYSMLPGCRSHPGHRLAGVANRARLFYWRPKLV